MDVQKTMEFILEQQAQMAAEQAKFDRRLNAIAKLVQVGMKELVELRKLHKDSEYKINALIDANQRHEEWRRENEKWRREHDLKFERLLNALLRQRTNGKR